MKQCLALFAAALLLVLSGCSLLPGLAQAEIQPEPASLVLEGSGFLDYGEDLDEVLTSEQEQILHDYFSRQYLALAKLESTSFGELFSDARQADYADAALDLQLELRRMQPLDYSLTGFEYELEVESITTLEDGSIRIRLTEDSVQNFTALPGVDSRRLGTSHHFVLESTGDRWLIRSHTLFDPLLSTLLYEYMDEYAGGQWDPGFLRDLDFSQDYIDAVPGYLEEAREQAELRLEQAEEARPSDRTAEEPYDREAAVAYAHQWVEDRSPDWEDYSQDGGNCQNYASQVLLAGGIPMDIQGNYIWKWYDDTVSNRNTSYGRSSSWSGVKQFMDYASGNTGFGLVAEMNAPYDTGEPGDLIHMGTDQDWRHTVVIVETVEGEDGSTADYLVNSNTANLQNYPASLYGYPDLILVHILGWNAD